MMKLSNLDNIAALLFLIFSLTVLATTTKACQKPCDANSNYCVIRDGCGCVESNDQSAGGGVECHVCNPETGPASSKDLMGCPVDACTPVPDGCELYTRYFEDKYSGKCCPSFCNFRLKNTKEVVACPYDSCEGRSEGDPCTICRPGDPLCKETAIIKSCQNINKNEGKLECKPVISDPTCDKIVDGYQCPNSPMTCRCRLARCMAPPEGCKPASKYEYEGDQCCPKPCYFVDNDGNECKDSYDTTCPKGCKTWFDGCNTCNCSQDGGSAVCTEKHCFVAQMPKCLESYDTTCPKGCKTWFDGCNKCNCSQDGRGAVCTKKHCSVYDSSECLLNWKKWCKRKARKTCKEENQYDRAARRNCRKMYQCVE